MHERVETASQLRDIARRIGPGAMPEWVRSELEGLARRLEFLPGRTETAPLDLDLPAIAREAEKVAAYCRRTGSSPDPFTDWPGTLAAVARRCVVAERRCAELEAIDQRMATDYARMVEERGAWQVVLDAARAVVAEGVECQTNKGDALLDDLDDALQAFDAGPAAAAPPTP